MKGVLVGIFSFFLFASNDVYADIGDHVSTAVKKVGKINIESGQNGATYYFIAEDENWSAANCPNAIYAYIWESDHGSKAILSLALSAKAQGQAIRFEGTCGSGTSDQYIKITRIEI